MKRGILKYTPKADDMVAALHLTRQTVCEIVPEADGRRHREVVEEYWPDMAKHARLRLVSPDGVIMDEGDASPAEAELYDPRDPSRIHLTLASIAGIRATLALERQIVKQPLSPASLLARRAIGKFSMLYSTLVLEQHHRLVAPRLLLPSQAAALRKLQPQLAGRIDEVAHRKPIRSPASEGMVDEFNIDTWQRIVKERLGAELETVPVHGVVEVVSRTSYLDLGEEPPVSQPYVTSALEDAADTGKAS